MLTRAIFVILLLHFGFMVVSSYWSGSYQSPKPDYQNILNFLNMPAIIKPYQRLTQDMGDVQNANSAGKRSRLVWRGLEEDHYGKD